MLYLAYSFVIFYLAGVAFGTSYKLRNPDKPIKWKDVLNPRKWLSIAVAVTAINLVPPHIVEQLALRIYDKQCSKCVKAGSCIDCGCAMPAKAYDPYAECSMGNWGPMILDKGEYKKFRKQYPITITVEHESQ